MHVVPAVCDLRLGAQMRATTILATFALLIGAAAPAASEQSRGWILRSPSPGAPPCRAVKFGDEVDTQLLRNRDNLLLLTVGHPGWEHNGDPDSVEASLSIDDSAPVSVR